MRRPAGPVMTDDTLPKRHRRRASTPHSGEAFLDPANPEGDPMNTLQIEGLLGRLLERSDANGRALDEVQKNMRRLDERLEGVAYRRDIETFVPRDEIERRIKEAMEGAKMETKESLGEIRRDVGRLQSLAVWAVGGLVAAFGGLLLKLIYSSAHIPG